MNGARQYATDEPLSRKLTAPRNNSARTARTRQAERVSGGAGFTEGDAGMAGVPGVKQLRCQ